MKKYIKYGTFCFVAGLIGLTGCNVDEVHYQDRTYTAFTDSVLYMPVTVDGERLFEVEVASTNTASIDRNYIVEVVHNKSNAIEGFHYELLSQNVTIPAGSRTGKLQMRGNFDRIQNNDSLAVTLRLVTLRDDSWDMYSQETNVSLIKCYPFNINDYVGDMMMSCTFPFGNNVSHFLLTTEKKDENTLIVKAPFSEYFDLRLKCTNDSEDPFNRDIIVAPQTAFIDVTYGKIYAQSVTGVPSYYIVPDRALVLYLNMFIPKVGAFGTYVYILQWLSPEEAEAKRNETGSPYSLANGFMNTSYYQQQKANITNINR